jgi:hypothetical protein
VNRSLAADGGGADGPAQPAHYGALIITELMIDPKTASDGEGEWFELYNPGSASLDLAGCAIADGSAQPHALTAHFTIAARSFASVARGEQPGFTPDIVASFSLKNGADVLELVCGGVSIDRVAYDKATGYSVIAGAAMSLDARNFDADANDRADVWCLATDAYAGDLGSPGRPNRTCEHDNGDAGSL